MANWVKNGFEYRWVVPGLVDELRELGWMLEDPKRELNLGSRERPHYLVLMSRPAIETILQGEPKEDDGDLVVPRIEEE